MKQPTVIWQEGFEGPQPAPFALPHHNARQVSVSFAGTAAEQAAGEASLQPQVAAIRSWLDELDVTTDFDANRSGMIEKILVLQAATPAAR